MCGIICLHKYHPEKIGHKILKRYRNQKERGSEGFGFVAVCDETKVTRQRFASEDKTIKAVQNTQAQTLLFHHRFPTSTVNIKECSHPIKVSHDSLGFDFYLAHNGIISNDGKLKETHNALGFVYETEIEQQTTINTKTGQAYNLNDKEIKWNDSEALAVDIARFINGDIAQPEARGSIAFIGFVVDKNTNQIKSLVWGRNEGSPLYIEKSEGGKIALASKSNGEEVKPDTLFVMNWRTNAITEIPMSSINTPTRYPLGFGTGQGSWNWADTTPDLIDEPSREDLMEELMAEIDYKEEEVETYREYKMFDEMKRAERDLKELNKQFDLLYTGHE